MEENLEDLQNQMSAMEQEKGQKERDCQSLEGELEKVNDSLTRAHKEKKAMEERIEVRRCFLNIREIEPPNPVIVPNIIMYMTSPKESLLHFSNLSTNLFHRNSPIACRVRKIRAVVSPSSRPSWRTRLPRPTMSWRGRSESVVMWRR